MGPCALVTPRVLSPTDSVPPASLSPSIFRLTPLSSLLFPITPPQLLFPKPGSFLLHLQTLAQSASHLPPLHSSRFLFDQSGSADSRQHDNLSSLLLWTLRLPRSVSLFHRTLDYHSPRAACPSSELQNTATPVPQLPSSRLISSSSQRLPSASCLSTSL